MFISPFELNVFTGEFMQVAGDMTEVRDEFAIVTNKTKKFLDFCDVLKRGGPFCDCFHLFRVDGSIAVRNNVSKVFNGCSSEFTFFELTVHWWSWSFCMTCLTWFTCSSLVGE